MKHQSPAPLLFGMGGVIFLCGMDAAVKALGASLPTFEIVAIRFFSAAIWLALYLLITRDGWPTRANIVQHLQRGLLNVFTATLFFIAITNLPLAIVTALGLTAPIYISLFGIVFLREPVSPSLLAAIGLGIGGALVVVFGNGATFSAGSGNLIAWTAAMLAPIAYAGALLLMKHHSSGESPAGMTLAQSLVSGVVILPFAAVDFVPPPMHIWWLVVLIGFLGAAGFILLITGLKRLPASIFAIVDYTALLWAALYGFVFFKEVPGPSLWLGGAMIIAACFLGMRLARRLVPAA